MNAIIFVCHFCEQHGPKILFCTQTLRCQEVNESEEDKNSGGRGIIWRDRGLSELVKTVKSASLAEQRLAGDGLLDVLPPEPPRSTPRDTLRHSDHTKSVCQGCQSVKTGYVSHDDEGMVSYVSTRHPHTPQIFPRIRQACIRSLSCEVCPGREGPIFFGDQQNGSVLSHTFYISDLQARGQQRLYSICVFMMDRIYLLNSWPFLLPQLQLVIDTLKNKARRVSVEEAEKTPPHQAVNRTSSQLEPHNFLKKKSIHNNPARSLAELTGDRDIFKVLHVGFVWTLKACGSRLTETLLEGPPTEDSIIDMESQEETEEGFIKINTRKISEEATPSCIVAEDGGGGLRWRGGEEEATRNNSAACSEEGSSTTSPTEGSQSRTGSSGSLVTSLRHLMKVMGGEKFRILAHHVVIGNQIIVCCPNKELVRLFFDALRILLPRGCCRVIYHSDRYEDSWRCNFLGQNPETVLPDHLESAEPVLLVEISPLAEHTPGEQNFTSLHSNLSEEHEDFRCWKFRLNNPVPLPEKVPTVLSRMQLALKNRNLSEKVVEQCLVCLREEWMNKVKVLFKFTKVGGGRSDHDTHRLLEVVGAREEDKPLLKFWMTGLSVQYRTHILASSKNC